MVRWLQRMIRVIATVVHAAIQTFRERRPSRPEGDVRRRVARVHREGAGALPETTENDEGSGVWVDGTLIELPRPSIWPAVVGLGTALMMFGVITSPGFSISGLIVLLTGLGGWIGELHHE